MPGLTASLAVAAAATLAVHPVAHPVAVLPEEAAAEPCVIILPLDPGSDTQLQDLLRELLAALEKLVGADGNGAPGDPTAPAAGGTDCPASTGRTGNADDAAAPGGPAPVPSPDGTAPGERGTVPVPGDPEPADPAPATGRGPGADDPSPSAPDAGHGDTGGTDQGDESGESEVDEANRAEASSGGSSPGGSGGDDSGGEDSGGEDSAGADASQGDDAGGDDAGGDDARGDDPGDGASAGDTSTGGGEDDDDGSSREGGEANDSDRSGGGSSGGAGSGDEDSDGEEPGSRESGGEDSGGGESDGGASGAEDVDLSPASASGTGGAVQTPGDLLDLQNFFLTLPVGPEGDPDSIDQPELLTYSSEHFQLTPEGDGVAFRAPTGGVTTENSKYPRSELREMNGEEKAAWSNTSGTHVLETRQAITQVPPAKPEVVAAQIHDGGDDVMQIRLEGQTLVAQYADGEEQIVIDPAYQLGAPYDLRIVAADGRVTVFYDGEQRAEIARSGTSWYFKIGAYTQSNPERGDSPDAAGEVVVYSLSIEHTGA